MNFDQRILAMIGRRIPQLAETEDASSKLRREGLVELNPQPLPPVGPPPVELGAAVAVEFLNLAWLGQRFGVDQRAVLEELDDMCPVHPRKIKLPPSWPRPHWSVRLTASPPHAPTSWWWVRRASLAI